MPGSLPANSGYTYAAEFSVDEALKAGATQVDFDQPLINYTENFIGAPVGSPVPTGYYDREDAKWKAAKNGRVIKVLDATGNVDTDGDGKADTGLGITAAERARLAQLYTPGQELWRVEITHFTPWDHNWPYGPPPGAKPPKLKEFEWGKPERPVPAAGLRDRLRDADARRVDPAHRHRHDARLQHRAHARAGRSTRRSRSRSPAARCRRG